MRLFLVATLLVALTSCGSTENPKSINQSSNVVVAKLFGGDLPVEKEWYVWDTCGIPKTFSKATVFVETDEIFIDFQHNRRPIAFDGTYDIYTGLIKVAGSDRARNGRIGKEPREGVFLPETGTVVLFKSKNANPNSQCEIILTLNDDVIDEIRGGDIVLPDVFKKQLVKTKKGIYSACDNGKTAQWIKQYWDNSGRYNRTASIDVFSPSVFRQTFNTAYTKDAHEYLVESITSDNYCGLEEAFSRGEVIKNQRKTQKLLSISNEGMKRRLVKNFIITQHDLWLLRVEQYLKSRDNQKVSSELVKVKLVAETYARFKKYSPNPYEILTKTIASKQDEYSALILSEKLNEYTDKLQLNLSELEGISKFSIEERELFSYLTTDSFKSINSEIALTINQHANSLLSTYLDDINIAQDINALVGLETRYRQIFSYLNSGLRQTIFSLRADYVYGYIDETLSRIYQQKSVTLDEIVSVSHYNLNNPRQWNTLANTQRERLDNKRTQFISRTAPDILRHELAKSKVEKIYAFHEFYYSTAKPILAFMNPKDQTELEMDFYKRLNSHCSLDMAITATILLDANGIKKHVLAIENVRDMVNFRDEDEAICYARLLINNDETIVQNQSQFVKEARTRFDNSVKYCSVLPDESISFLKENQNDLPLYELMLSRLEKPTNAARRGINRIGRSISNSECTKRFPYLPFMY